MRERVHGPFGLDAVREQTVRCQRTVLVVGHSPVPTRCGPAIPTALGFGLLSRAHGIFEASAFVVGALGVLCVTLSVIVVKRR